MVEYRDEMLQHFFVKDRAATAAILKEAGARLVKEWNAVSNWQVGMAYANAKSDGEREEIRKRHGREHFLGDPAEIFSFRKENGMKILLCLEHYSVFTDVAAGAKTNDIAIVRNTICDYLKWIIDSGFKDQVAGFELGNEPYWGKDPENYGERWCAIVPEIKKIWPDAQIGMPLAEYRPDDPDIAAVRARCEDTTWCEDGGEFSFSRLNQWSGRFIVAMKPVLDEITHVIYHFYGADAAYGCSASGFRRIDNFAKVFPEIRDKKVWITEWRERSDENNRCHQAFASALWKSHYLLAVLARPDIDGVCNHCIASLSGGVFVSDGRAWQVQWDAANRNYADSNAPCAPHMELGPSGPLFRLYANALLSHQIVMKHGVWDKQGPDTHLWLSAMYYGNHTKGGPEWIAAMDHAKSSLAVLVANSSVAPWCFSLDIAGLAPLGEAVVDEVVCRSDRVDNYVIPEEPRPWVESRRRIQVSGDGAFVCAIPPYAYAVVTVPLRASGTPAAAPSEAEAAAAISEAESVRPPAPVSSDVPPERTIVQVDPMAYPMPGAPASARVGEYVKAVGRIYAEKSATEAARRYGRMLLAMCDVPVRESAGLRRVPDASEPGFDISDEDGGGLAADFLDELSVGDSSETFRYLALVSKNKAYLGFAMVNSGDAPVVGEIAPKGFKLANSMAVREIRIGADGKAVQDCREENCGPLGSFTCEPKSFQTIIVPMSR